MKKREKHVREEGVINDGSVIEKKKDEWQSVCKLVHK